MASIYSSSIRPAWDSGNTFLAFLGTTILFGALGSVAFIIQGSKGNKLSPELISVLKKISLAGIAALLIQLVYLPVYYSALSGGGDAALASAQTLAGTYAPMMVIRWVLSVIGAALLVYTLFKKGNTTPAIPLNTVYLAFALVLVGEFLGRYIFYASAVSIMVG
ncbi:DmsC/YnfH family molybdoenzyme membrane anchor subunit [Desulfosporosinus shakirovi]|uniref:DmsC/YnfH family molybdoenzyme membrane anchor subunit n=1 Tax=Desulfosporosinus shakirovi TaxID=2885154 RepID=UPI00249F4105|nr:DmsC/YnfH family molybdoenzyme membrane anchor subunit [Desulfosporosinus sp. SRJS8]